MAETIIHEEELVVPDLQRIAYRFMTTEKTLTIGSNTMTIGLGRVQTLSLIRLYARPIKKEEIVMTKSLPTEGVDQMLLSEGMLRAFAFLCRNTIESMGKPEDYLEGRGEHPYIQLDTDLTTYTVDTIQSRAKIYSSSDTHTIITTTPFCVMDSKASEIIEQAIKEWMRKETAKIIQPPLNIYPFLTDELDKARENGLNGKESSYHPDVGRNLEIEIYKRIKHLLKEDVVREYEEKKNAS